MRIIKSHSVFPLCLEWPHQFTTGVKYWRREKKRIARGRQGNHACLKYLHFQSMRFISAWIHEWKGSLIRNNSVWNHSWLPYLGLSLIQASLHLLPTAHHSPGQLRHTTPPHISYASIALGLSMIKCKRLCKCKVQVRYISLHWLTSHCHSFRIQMPGSHNGCREEIVSMATSIKHECPETVRVREEEERWTVTYWRYS